MSGNFNIKIEGLDLLQKQLVGKEALSKILPDINSSIKLFTEQLNSRVAEKYTNKVALNSVLSSKVRTTGGDLTYSLSYKYKAQTLDKFKYRTSIEPTTKPAYIPLAAGTTNFRWKETHTARQVRTQIKKDVQLAVATRYKASPFKVFKIGNSLFTRLQAATWATHPSRDTLGVRAPYAVAFGPSLSQLAASVYENDSKFKASKNLLEANLIKAFVRYYARN